jgi:hypothetical protein
VVVPVPVGAVWGGWGVGGGVEGDGGGKGALLPGAFVFFRWDSANRKLGVAVGRERRNTTGKNQYILSSESGPWR